MAVEFEFFRIVVPEAALRMFVEAAQRAFASVPTPFRYPEAVRLAPYDQSVWNKQVQETKRLNANFFDAVSGKGGIYAFYKDATESPFYVGKTKGKNARSRLTSHLIAKNDKTGAKLQTIQEIVWSGGNVHVTFVEVAPETLREFFEETIQVHFNLRWGE